MHVPLFQKVYLNRICYTQNFIVSFSVTFKRHICRLFGNARNFHVTKRLYSIAMNGGLRANIATIEILKILSKFNCYTQRMVLKSCSESKGRGRYISFRCYRSCINSYNSKPGRYYLMSFS